MIQKNVGINPIFFISEKNLKSILFCKNDFIYISMYMYSLYTYIKFSFLKKLKISIYSNLNMLFLLRYILIFFIFKDFNDYLYLALKLIKSLTAC